MKVHLVDGTYELFRHYYAVPSHINRDGQEVAAVRGVLGSMLDRSSGVGKAARGVGLTGVAGLLAAAGGPFLLSGMLGMFGQLLPSTTASETAGESYSEGETAGRSTSLTATEGTTSSESLSFGREYLNKNAEACEQLLEETTKRFEIARGQGCWNVGVYMLTDQAEAAAQAQAQLKADIYVYSEGLTDDQIKRALLTPCRDIEQTIAELQQKFGPEARICALPEGPQTIPYLREIVTG